jgi:hypothetical protein
MSESVRRALVARGSFVALVVALVSGACHEDETRVEVLPLQVELLQGPDTLVVGATDTLRVGAMVGYVGCTLDKARLERQGNSLVVRGEARCEYRVGSYSRLGLETAPAEPNGQTLEFLLAGLEPGTYLTVAADLVDTLVVSPSAPTSPQQRVVARGDIILTPPLCPPLPLFVVYLPRLNPLFELVDLVPPSMPQPVILRAVLLQPSACADVSGVLRVRSWVPADP